MFLPPIEDDTLAIQSIGYICMSRRAQCQVIAGGNLFNALIGQREFFAESGILTADVSTPPGMWLTQWHLTAHYVSRLHLYTSSTPSIFVHGCVSLRCE